MAGTFSNGKIADGYTLDGYSYESDWVDVASFSKFSVTAVLVGGSPTGTFSLQESNDLQWTGTTNKPKPLHVGNSQFANDAVLVPSGGGQSTVSVSGAGAYCMNQYWAPYRWFKVIYTAIGAPSTTTLDIFFTAKE